MDCCVSITVRIIGSFATSLASGAGLLRQTSKYSARPRRSSSNATPAGMMRHQRLLATARICGAEERANRRHSKAANLREDFRSEEHKSELQSLKRISNAV